MKDFSAKSKHTIHFPNLDYALLSASHDESLPRPIPPASWTLGDDEHGDGDRNNDSDFAPSVSSTPHLITQNELHDLARDLNLSKVQSELSGSRLQT